MKQYKLTYETEKENRHYKIIEQNFKTDKSEEIAEVEIKSGSVTMYGDDQYYESFTEFTEGDDIDAILDDEFKNLLQKIYQNKRYYKKVNTSQLKDLQSEIKLTVEGYIGSEIDFMRNYDPVNQGGL